MKSANQRKDHHFVPQGFMKPWETEINGRKIINVIKLGNERQIIHERPKSISGINYEEFLYTVGFHPNGNDYFEVELFSPIDNEAFNIKKKIIEKGIESIEKNDLNKIFRFIFLMEGRSPKFFQAASRCAVLRASILMENGKVSNTWRDNINLSWRKFYKSGLIDYMNINDALTLEVIEDMISEGTKIFQKDKLKWDVIEWPKGKSEVILSDRPSIICAGDKENNLYPFLLFPLSPEKILTLAHPVQIKKWKATSPKRFTRKINSLLLIRADKRVIIHTDMLRNFVQENWIKLNKQKKENQMFEKMAEPMHKTAILDSKTAPFFHDFWKNANENEKNNICYVSYYPNKEDPEKTDIIIENVKANPEFFAKIITRDF